MRFTVDLHTHSRFARATSPQLDSPTLALWARRKGLAVIGSGDILHPGWREEFKSSVVPAEPGLYRLRDDLEREVEGLLPASCRGPVRFMLSAEVSCVYQRGGRLRKVHQLVYAPDFARVDSLADALSRFGDLAEDGRPTLAMDSRDLLAATLAASSEAYLIPAHSWTPWFGIFGSRSGFDSLEECFGDLSGEVFALETGLSADPPMNWRVSGLERIQIASFSDAHSPAKLAREATELDCDLDYAAIRHAFATGEGFAGTVEFFPEEGKYHFDGHRACDVCWHPDETARRRGICPVCGRTVTVGVLSRVNGLADLPVGTAPPNAPEVAWLVPLHEVLSEITGVGVGSKRVGRLYDRALEVLGPELEILRSVPLARIEEALGAQPTDLFGEPQTAAHNGRRGGPPDDAIGSVLAGAIGRMRAGKVERQPGFDGRYGAIRLLPPREAAPAVSI
jgi:DNA helicase-2/ATP-dependent DNA helicase PcrA